MHFEVICYVCCFWIVCPQFNILFGLKKLEWMKQLRLEDQ